MSRTKHDYPALRLEYIQTDISIRELCRKHGIANWSSVNAMKTKAGWDEDRAKFRMKAQSHEIEGLVESRMRDLVETHSELLLAIRGAIRRYYADVTREKDPQTVTARDLQGLANLFLLLSGQPTARTESKNLDVHDFGGILAGAPAELLRELAELARANGAGAKPVGRGPLVVLEGTRSA